jgi:hypothetical protein
MRRNRIAVGLGLLASIVLGYALLSQRSVVALDFRAFYCAGAALREHKDPYLTASIRSCEIMQTDSLYRERLPGTALPAPQPLYDIVLFSAFAALPFAVAKALWGGVLGAALFVTMFSLLRLTRLPAPVLLAVLITSLIGGTLALGQIVPIYMAAACSAALLLQRGYYDWAGVAAAGTLIEPHLGLPLCVAVALWSPRSRVPVIASCAALAAISLAAGGVAGNVEYATKVLPLHALSEIGSDGQLSLSVILRALHVPNGAALEAGTLSYLVFGAIGIWQASPASKCFKNRALLVAVPAATAVIGGTFVHQTEIVAALPVVLLLISIRALRGIAVALLILLATPWQAQSAPDQMLLWFVIAAVCTAYEVRTLANVKPLWSVLCGAVVFAFLTQVNLAYERERTRYVQHPHAATVAIDERYPQAGWARIDEGTYWTQNAFAWVMRAPAWGGLLLLSGTLVVVTRRHPRSTSATRNVKGDAALAH